MDEQAFHRSNNMEKKKHAVRQWANVPKNKNLWTSRPPQAARSLGLEELAPERTQVSTSTKK
jgi:hypothetical protein